MNTKTKYMLPVFAAVFALMFAAATPYVVAEPGQGKYWDKDGSHDYRQDIAEKLNQYCEMSSEEQAELIEKHNKTEEMVVRMNQYCSLDEEGRQAFIAEHKDQYRKYHDDKKDKYNKHHMMIKVDGFTGSIVIPDMSEVEDKKAVHRELKEKITVKLSDAAIAAEDAGLEIMKGSIGIAVNEDGVKSVVWILVAVNMDDSEKISKTIFVVDAANAGNTAQITKELDHVMLKQDKRYTQGYDKLSDPEKIQVKIANIEKKLAMGTGNADVDAAKTKFVELLKELQAAIADGDDAKTDSIREQLKEIRNQMIDLKKFR